MASEQPFKKRRRYEQLMAEGAAATVSPQPETPQAPPAAPEVVVTKEEVVAPRPSDTEVQKEEVVKKDEVVKKEEVVKREKVVKEEKVVREEVVKKEKVVTETVIEEAVKEAVKTGEDVVEKVVKNDEVVIEEKDAPRVREEVANESKKSGEPVVMAHPAVEVSPEDEKLRKKRNREEIGNFYKAYRRVRMCLTRRDDPGAFGVKHDLEAAYHSMIELSQGERFFCHYKYRYYQHFVYAHLLSRREEEPAIAG